MYILSDKIVTTRKEHKCNACLRVFKPGTRMKTQVNTFDGIGVWRLCPTCQVLLKNFKSYFEDDYDYLFHEGCVNEMLQLGQTPEELLNNLNNINEK